MNVRMSWNVSTTNSASSAIRPMTCTSPSFSGGTGKTKITCEKVKVIDGKAAATIVFSSSKYGYVKANGEQYNVLSADENGSRFEFPVDLNVENTIIGMTTAMEEAHEIEYKITITLAEPEATPAPAATEAPAREDGDYTPDAGEIGRASCRERV